MIQMTAMRLSVEQLVRDRQQHHQLRLDKMTRRAGVQPNSLFIVEFERFDRFYGKLTLLTNFDDESRPWSWWAAGEIKRQMEERSP